MSAFVPVAATAGYRGLSHLVAHSPALLGQRVNQLPVSTLCGLAVDSRVDVEVGEIGCERCLYRAPRFMGLPGWRVVA